MATKVRRIFLGIPVPADTALTVAKQLQTFPGKTIPPQNWHLTLHFLSHIEDEKLLLIHKGLQTLTLGDSFLLTFDHLGAFPHPKRARVLFVGAHDGAQETDQIVQITGSVLSPLGFTIDPRPYVPHLTVRRYSRPENIATMIDTHTLQKVSMTVDQLVLYESILSEEAPPKYIQLCVYDLGSASRES